MTSIDHGRAAHTPIAYKHQRPSTHPASNSLNGNHQKQKKRHGKNAAAQTDKQLVSEQAQFSGDELERMWHRGYMMALKDILILFDDARVPKT